MKIEYAKVSALGDRQDNQDRAAVIVSEDAAIMLVFDGMGGHADGAIAAEVGMKTVQDVFTSTSRRCVPTRYLFPESGKWRKWLSVGNQFRGQRRA